MRDALSDWLDGASAPSAPGTGNGVSHLDPKAVGGALRLWSGPTGGGGARRTGGSSGSSGRGRSSGGAQRSVARVAGPAGSAATLSTAYLRGERAPLAAAGLDLDELRALDDPLEVRRRIVDAAFQTEPDSTIADAEARLVVADLVTWTLQTPRDPEQIVRHTVELMIARSILTEVGDTIRQQPSAALRREAENEIRLAAKAWAMRFDVTAVALNGPSISAAVATGVADLLAIYGDES
ncbi:hypothetical protein [uncultured Microbacterium sp.]|uniref:hypothetical protein n=1 Tax=uncultured Microbacterium sp. TaxID=191216 RepID=UPI0025EAFFF9|nr:hypothetical protein [uncultured Microbacterium sp.]